MSSPGVESFIKNRPDWVAKKAWKKKSFDNFVDLGFPNFKDEDWKYTNLSSLAKEKILLEQKPTAEEFEKQILPEDFVRISFVNGVREKQALDKLNKLSGVFACDFDEAVEQGLPGAAESLSEKKNFYAELNQALSFSGIYLKVDKNVDLEKTILFSFANSAEASDMRSWFFPHIFVYLDEAAKARFFQEFFGRVGKGRYATSTVSSFAIQKNAHCSFAVDQNESLKASHLSRYIFKLQEGAFLEAGLLSRGSELSRFDLTAESLAENARMNLFGLLLPDQQQHMDLHTESRHGFENGRGEHLFKSILKGKSRAVFNGKIYIAQDAQKVNVDLQNKNLILDADCEVDTKPELEIYADDVKATHGATIGRISEEEIFYLQSRAIDKQEAYSLLSRGFASDAFMKLESGALRSELFNRLNCEF